MKFARSFAKRKLAALPYIGVDENDLAQSAFEQFTLEWHPAMCAAEAYLCMRVKHEIDATLRRGQTFGISYGYPDNVVNLRDPQQLQDEILEEQQRKEELLQFIKKRSAEAHAYAALIFQYDEKITRREAADLMQVAPTHIDYLKRILRDVMAKFLAEQSNSDSPAQRLLKK
jgi:hypothetical protein